MTGIDGLGEAADYGRVALEFVDALDRLPKSEDVIAAIGTALGEFGFEHFAMSELPYPFQAHLPRVFAIRAPLSWQQHYVGQGYHRIDPVIRACREAVQPFRWRDLRPGPQDDPRSIEVMRRARDFGLDHGFTLPIRNLNGLTSCFAMSGSQQPYLNRFTRPALHLMALYAFERLRELDTTVLRPRPVLSKREAEVLTWAAVGKSTWAISEKLGIAERTVIAHVANAMRKLDATSRTQAVATAMSNKLIQL